MGRRGINSKIIDGMEKFLTKVGFVKESHVTEEVTRNDGEPVIVERRKFVFPERQVYSVSEGRTVVAKTEDHLVLLMGLDTDYDKPYYSVSMVMRLDHTGVVYKDWRCSQNFYHDGFSAYSTADIKKDVVREAAHILGRIYLVPQMADYRYEDARKVFRTGRHYILG